MGGIPSFQTQVSPNNENPLLFTKNNTFPVGKKSKSNCFFIPCQKKKIFNNINFSSSLNSKQSTLKKTLIENMKDASNNLCNIKECVKMETKIKKNDNSTKKDSIVKENDKINDKNTEIKTENSIKTIRNTNENKNDETLVIMIKSPKPSQIPIEFLKQNNLELKENENKKMFVFQSEFQKGEKFLKGPHGKVYEALSLTSGDIWAVKSIPLDIIKLEENNISFFTKNLIDIDHINILSYIDVGISNDDQKNMELVSEFVAGGCLKRLIEKFGKIEEKVVSLFTKQILNGLHFLHSLGIYHGNLKSTNCLIESNGTLKLSDYYLFPITKYPVLEDIVENKSNISEFFQSQISDTQSFQVSENLKANYYDSFDENHWTPPEVLYFNFLLIFKVYYKHYYITANDIWSVGCIVVEMLTGESLWNKFKKMQKDQNYYYKNIVNYFPENISINCRNFLIESLNEKFEERSNVINLLNHPFITNSDMELIDEEDEQFSKLFNSTKSLAISKYNSNILASFVQSGSNFIKSGDIYNITNNNNNNNIVSQNKISKYSNFLKNAREKFKISCDNIHKIDEKSNYKKEFSGSVNENNTGNINEENSENENNIDFNAQKRKEFEQSLLKEFEDK